MTFADMLVRVMPSADRELGRLLVAVDLAKRFQSRLDGVFIDHNAARKTAWARTLFDRAVSRTSLDTSWRVLDGASADSLAFQARRSDLIILPSSIAGRDKEYLAPERVALDAGRPVLILPADAASMSIGHDVLVAWDDTPETARALHEAMPILSFADKVSILTVMPNEGLTALADRRLLEHLRHHGVAANFVSRSGDPAEETAEEARGRGVDLLVIGLHNAPGSAGSTLDGAGRRLTRSARLPVLCSW